MTILFWQDSWSYFRLGGHFGARRLWNRPQLYCNAQQSRCARLTAAVRLRSADL